jgi:hypothetical protein
MSEQTVTTEAEIVAEAQGLSDEPVTTVLQACEAYYMSGTPDDQSGDVEAPTGHFYRVDRWIVTTDSRGFRDLQAFPSELEAIDVFTALDDEYAAWGSDTDEL